MKKQLKLLAVCLSLSVSFFSCQKEPTPDEQHQTEIAMHDAAASMEFIIEMAEMPASYFCPECVLAGAAVAGAAASAAVASIHEPKIPIAVDLPSELTVSNNPQESVGVMHNRALNYTMNNVPKTELMHLLSERNVKILTGAATDCIPYKKEERQLLIDNVSSMISQKSERLNRNFQKYFKLDEISNFKNLGQPSLLVDEAKLFCSNFISKFNNNRSKNIIDNIKYINTEIINEINNSDEAKLKTLKLTFLSVYKHSYYYWNNKN